jgi:hypothetical protein
LKEHPEISRAIEEKLLERFGLLKKQKEGGGPEKKAGTP